MQVLNAYSYSEFIEHIQRLYTQGKATGTDHSDDRLKATKINLQRFKRLNKTAQINPEIIRILNEMEQKWRWTVIAEGWCGDAAQILPYIQKIADSVENISLEIILRDEHSEIMDRFLTNGSRSIPILICYGVDLEVELGFWGPRPKRMIEWIKDFKEANKSYTPEAFKMALHGFYAHDKGKAINSDLLKAVTSWAQVKTD